MVGLWGWEDLPAWYRDIGNPYLLSGYRRMNEKGRVAACARSVCAWHNESVNIWLHLGGSGVALAALLVYAGPHAQPASPDSFFLCVYLAGCLACLGCSVVAHTMTIHSESICTTCTRADYVCISLFLAGYSLSVVHRALRDGPAGLEIAYLGAVGATHGLAIWKSVADPCFYGEQYTHVRIMTFVGSLAACAAGLLHAHVGAYASDMAEIWGAVGRVLVVEGAGTLAYALHFPERWFPRRFDFLGASHQLWHVAVLVGMYLHYRFLIAGLGANWLINKEFIRA